MTIRQRVSRYSRWLDAAEAAQNEPEIDRNERLFMQAMNDEVEHESRPALPEPAPTRAGQFTIESTVDMSDEELKEHYLASHDDPHAKEAIARVMDWRDEQDAKRDAEIAEMRSTQERARFDDGWGSMPSDALHSPARRPQRALNPDQQAREEYQRYVSAQYLQALGECKTAMLNSRGRAAGIDEYDLFSGPEHTARAYASEELQSWWRRNGRLTSSAFRYHLLGRDSDREAAVRANNADFNDAA